MCTIRGRYRQCGINPSGDGRGIIDIQEAHRCNGSEVWIRSDLGTRILRLESHIRPLSLNDLGTLGPTLPICWGEGDQTRTPTNGDACAVLGNDACWEDIDGNSTVEVDTMWIPTPLILWKKMTDEVLGTYDVVDMGARQSGTTPRDELCEVESGCRSLEFSEEMGTRPPSSAYQAAGPS